MPIKNETGTVVFFLISVKDISKSNPKINFAREREGVKGFKMKLNLKGDSSAISKNGDVVRERSSTISPAILEISPARMFQ